MAGYQMILQENGIQQNMSKKGNYLDNNAMENFFGRLKLNVITTNDLRRSNK